MAKQNVKKVGGASAPAKQDGKVKKEKKVRPEFDLESAVNDAGESVLNEDGKLTTFPANFKFGEFKPLKKDDFADKGGVMLYRAALMQLRGERMLKLAGDLRTGAANFAKFGDDKQAKKVKKLQKMREQYAALQKELAAEGIELDSAIE